jgi:cell division septal protein FtsQ
MRLLYTSLIAISVGVLQYIDNPAIFHRAWAAVTTAGSETVSQKEVRIEGLKVLPRAEVERVLPYDRSVLWWHVNGTDIQSKVAESPWIDEATVESCPGGALRSWGCFVLAVKERTPRFLGLVDNERWIIDSEGAFIMPSGGSG